jgi:uncharacterized protein (DUF697 family)
MINTQDQNNEVSNNEVDDKKVDDKKVDDKKVAGSDNVDKTSNNANAEALSDSDKDKRAHAAHHLVLKYTLGSTAIAAIPIPFVDLAAIMAAQLKMLHSISQQYAVPFSQDIVKSLVTTLISGTISATTTASFSSLIKSVPVVGSIAGFLSSATLYSATTYALGKIFIQHFESGGTFLDFEPEQMRQHFQELLEEGQQFIAKHRDKVKVK